jgi:hypothetical protein
MSGSTGLVSHHVGQYQVKIADQACLITAEAVVDGGSAPGTSERRGYARPNRNFTVSNKTVVPWPSGHRSDTSDEAERRLMVTYDASA